MKKKTLLLIALLIEVAYMQTLPPLLMDNTNIFDVPGESGVNKWWTDSYSVGDRCYCSSWFDSTIGSILVMTPYGNKTVKEACDLIGPGPGIVDRPTYNDIQCGNGPPNERGDEITCPGRTEYGKDGCKYIGPNWKFNVPMPVPLPTSQPKSVPVITPLTVSVHASAPKPKATRRPVPRRKTLPRPVPIPVPVPVPQPKPIPIYFNNPVPVPVPAPLRPPSVPISPPIFGKVPLLQDYTKILTLPGLDAAPGWEDSYSVGDKCYCSSSFDHQIGSKVVNTPFGNKTVKEVCDILGPGPGKNGRPVYNDIQCGNGPPNDDWDEELCPGRSDWGKEGCKYIGPTWKFL